MNPIDTVPLMLLALHMLALAVITVIFIGMFLLHRRARALQEPAQSDSSPVSPGRTWTRQPAIWLAVRTSDTQAVKSALRVGRTIPCSWFQGIAGEHDLFIGAPVNDWIIVTGSGLPHPGCDVDRCFHFLIRLSHILGHVQFFMADFVSSHHAWVRVEDGVVKRAYAWTGETVWNQGSRSLAEVELELNCYAYAESAGRTLAAAAKSAAYNARQVPLLAARWSINPMTADTDPQSRAGGIAGRSALFRED